MVVEYFLLFARLQCKSEGFVSSFLRIRQPAEVDEQSRLVLQANIEIDGILHLTGDVIPFTEEANRGVVLTAYRGKNANQVQVESRMSPTCLFLALIPPPFITDEAEGAGEPRSRSRNPPEHVAIRQPGSEKLIGGLELARVEEQLDGEEHRLDFLQAPGRFVGRLAFDQVGGAAGGVGPSAEQEGAEVVAEDRVAGAAVASFHRLAREDAAHLELPQLGRQDIVVGQGFPPTFVEGPRASWRTVSSATGDRKRATTLSSRVCTGGSRCS